MYYIHCVQVLVDHTMPAVKLATVLATPPTASVIMAVTPGEIAAGTLTRFAPRVSDQLAVYVYQYYT